jgi:hypothetical protein
MTSPPPWEVADVIRMMGARFLDSLNRAQRKVLNAIERCRTAALGGHRDQCVRCGHQTITFHSCRNRPLSGFPTVLFIRPAGGVSGPG